LTYIDRARPEYEPLLILKFFRGPHDFRSKNIFFMRFRRKPSGKIIFFGKFLKIAKIYFRILFLHNKFIFGNLSLKHEKVSVSANKLEALKTIY
jgi:hypothetical protein